MKKTLFVLLMIASLFPHSAKSQVFMEFECNTSNLWGSMVFGLPTRLMNFVFVSESRGGIPMSLWSITSSTVKKNGEEVADYNNYSFWGLNGIMKDISYNVKLGWQPDEIPVGIFAIAGWRHEGFEMRLDCMKEPFKYHIQCYRLGLGLRLSPLRNMLSSSRIAPILEVGSTYDTHLPWGRVPFGNDLDQLNNGITYRFGFGVRWNNDSGSGMSFIVGCETKKYNQFNTAFEYNGLIPYEGITTSNHLWTFNLVADM